MTHHDPPDYSNFKHFRVTFPAEYVAHVEINRPEKYNSFTHEMFSTLTTLFNHLSTSPLTRAILLTGTGPTFSSGLDVHSASTSGPVGNPSPADDIARRTTKIRRHALAYQAAVSSLEKCEKPIICGMHGITYGAAIDFATAADIRICSDDVRFCIREIEVGLAPDIGTLSRLPKVGVGYSWAKEVVFTAREWGGGEAERVGFVSRVCGGKEEMVRVGLEIAGRIAGKSPVAVQSAKALWDFSRDASVEDGLRVTAAWNGVMVQSEDVKKAMMSGVRKTKTTFEKL